MTLRSRIAQADTATVLRWGILVLAALGVAGAALELLLLKHWTTVGMVFGWVTVLACAVAAALAARSNRRSLVAARWVALAGIALAIIGVVLHVRGNWEAGQADGTLGAVWATLPVVERIWDAATGAVGKAPPLAPGALAEASLLGLLATARHPALAARRPD